MPAISFPVQLLSTLHLLIKFLTCFNTFLLTFAFLSDSVGVKWSDLKSRLNSKFDWDSAVKRSLETNIKLEDAIAAGSIFVVQYPLFDDLVSVPDITEPRPTRKMWPALSPIALFASRPGKSGAPAQLKPVAIQLDYKSGMITPGEDLITVGRSHFYNGHVSLSPPLNHSIKSAY